MTQASEKFTVDVDKMTQAVEDLTIKLITIEGNGDADAAAAFLQEYSYISPDLQAFLDKANATVPVEFVPSFSVASVPSGTPTTEAPATDASITSTAATSATGPIPLADAIADMEPQAVWQNFYDLTQVPRPSHHEEQATAFLSNSGEQLGLETTVNDVGDVIIRKPGSPGFEDAPTVILQGHMDMVAQKTPDSDHDFETDPIEAYVEDGWVHAISTTLGADDGIGVAIAMAILQDDSLVHPPLEAVFTTNEEDGFTGINGLDSSDLQASTLHQHRLGRGGSFCISSAVASILMP
ncbi:MAG: M20/M25/M40 family metallo-hydrolase [Anaerolineales bacterium]|nr:M20/M25/M40 family metallo-hydrolase [Anaerolineales bacterium]